MNSEVAATLITAIGGIIIALVQTGNFRGRRIERSQHRVEQKIDGIRDGTMPEITKALLQIREERELRRIQGLPMRRKGDAYPSIDHPTTPGKVITVDEP